MSRDKQIEEMRYLADEMGKAISTELEKRYLADERKLEEVLKANGYRKSTELAEEIFAEIEDKFDKMIDEATNELSSALLECDLKTVKFLHYHIDVLRMTRITIGTLQNKYIGEDTNVTTNTEDKGRDKLAEFGKYSPLSWKYTEEE